MSKLTKLSKIVSGIGSIILMVIIIALLINKGIPYHDEEKAIVVITLLTCICTLFNLYQSASQDEGRYNNDGIISLWLKRKKLEEKKRIADLEK
ncbi:hypothetical protein [Serratia bockelmannii]|uniref:hypothetical protein n=1 Tax=Serratia bockelmannii TaxID=2703793 RepID=UPI002360EA38|nr:hypothetical protein [Serratia bockelmannii]